MEKINWVEIVNKIIESKGKLKPLVFDNQQYDFALFENLSKMGFMVVWNVSSLRAIYLSRMKVPDGMSAYSIEDTEVKYGDIVRESLKFEEPF